MSGRDINSRPNANSDCSADGLNLLTTLLQTGGLGDHLINAEEIRTDFLSTFTTFGMPQDITLTSLRIEHLIPADAPTWQVMRAAYAEYAALVL